MKKSLMILPLLLLVACGDDALLSSSSSSESISIKKEAAIEIYQMYEEVYESNIWSNPRYDNTFILPTNVVIDFKVLNFGIRPSYHCKYPMGYFWKLAYFFDDQLTEKVPDDYILMDDITIYYGCRG